MVGWGAGKVQREITEYKLMGRIRKKDLILVLFL